MLSLVPPDALAPWIDDRLGRDAGCECDVLLGPPLLVGRSGTGHHRALEQALELVARSAAKATAIDRGPCSRLAACRAVSS